MLGTAKTNCLLLGEARTTDHKAVVDFQKAKRNQLRWKSVQYSSAARFTDLQPALFLLIRLFSTSRQLPPNEHQVSWKSGVNGKAATGPISYNFFMFEGKLQCCRFRTRAYFSQDKNIQIFQQMRKNNMWVTIMMGPAKWEQLLSKKIECEVVLRPL